ncbi:MAG: hypothetical protein RLZZ303_3229 [Candidatus Hydrogenedentota bacterium]
MIHPPIRLVWGLLLGVLSFASIAMAQEEEAHLRVVDGVVYRSETAIRIKALHDAEAAQRGTALSNMVPAMARVAECGGNTLSFDAFGLNETGSSISPEAVAAITAFAERAKDQRMGVMLRVVAGISDPDVRLRAARTVAKAFKKDTRIFFLLDGPDSAELCKVFKRHAPNAVVVGAWNADILVLESPQAQRYEATPHLVVGTLPEDPALHFILEANPENFARMDAAFMNEVELGEGLMDPIVLTQAERNEGFVPLFNGRSLAGWWVFGDNPAGFHVSDCGEIEWVMEGAGALMSAKRYGDFILRLDYKLLPGYNSGIFLRAPREARQSRIGMEFQLHGDHGLETPNDDCTGAIYKVVPPLVVASRPGATWNELEIMMKGPMLKATLNGVVVQDINLDDHEELRYRLRRGFIGLQDHSNYVSFRNIRIKELK